MNRGGRQANARRREKNRETTRSAYAHKTKKSQDPRISSVSGRFSCQRRCRRKEGSQGKDLESRGPTGISIAGREEKQPPRGAAADGRGSWPQVASGHSFHRGPQREHTIQLTGPAATTSRAGGNPGNCAARPSKPARACSAQRLHCVTPAGFTLALQASASLLRFAANMTGSNLRVRITSSSCLGRLVPLTDL